MLLIGSQKNGKISPLQIIGRDSLNSDNPKGAGILTLPINTGMSGLLLMPAGLFPSSAAISQSSPMT